VENTRSGCEVNWTRRVISLPVRMAFSTWSEQWHLALGRNTVPPEVTNNSRCKHRLMDFRQQDRVSSSSKQRCFTTPSDTILVQAVIDIYKKANNDREPVTFAAAIVRSIFAFSWIGIALLGF
jgi:hypothetical protein